MEASQLHTIKGKGIDRSLTKLSDSTKPSYFNNQITPDSKIATGTNDSQRGINTSGDSRREQPKDDSRHSSRTQ